MQGNICRETVRTIAKIEEAVHIHGRTYADPLTPIQVAYFHWRRMYIRSVMSGVQIFQRKRPRPASRWDSVPCDVCGHVANGLCEECGLIAYCGKMCCAIDHHELGHDLLCRTLVPGRKAKNEEEVLVQLTKLRAVLGQKNEREKGIVLSKKKARQLLKHEQLTDKQKKLLICVAYNSKLI